jgi:hypothetical protein
MDLPVAIGAGQGQRRTKPRARCVSVVLPMGARLAVCVLLAHLILPAKADDARMTPLVLERVIPLPHVAGRVDHMAVDLRRGRLFVAELGNNTVDVVDLVAGHVIHRIEGRSWSTSLTLVRSWSWT